MILVALFLSLTPLALLGLAVQAAVDRLKERRS